MTESVQRSAPAATRIRLAHQLEHPSEHQSGGLTIDFPSPGLTGLTLSMLGVSVFAFGLIFVRLNRLLQSGGGSLIWLFILAALANTAFALFWIIIARTATQVSVSREHFSLQKMLGSLSLGSDQVRLDKIQSFELDEAARIDKGVSIWRLALRLKDHDGLHYPFGQGYSLDELRWLQSELNACLVTEP